MSARAMVQKSDSIVNPEGMAVNRHNARFDCHGKILVSLTQNL
jgi:hypothetical protein